MAQLDPRPNHSADNRLRQHGFRDGDGRFASASAVRAVLQTGVLGDEAKDRLLILRVDGPEDFAPPLGPNWTIVGASLIQPWTRKVFRESMEERFKYARGELSLCEKRGPVKDVEPDEQSNAVRLLSWAARDGDPRNGPAGSLDEVLPLEVGYSTHRQILLWVRRLPRSEEPTETLAAEGE